MQDASAYDHILVQAVKHYSGPRWLKETMTQRSQKGARSAQSWPLSDPFMKSLLIYMTYLAQSNGMGKLDCILSSVSTDRSL